MFSFCFHSVWKMHAIFLISWCHITVHNFIWFLHYSFKKFGQPTRIGSSQKQQSWFSPIHPPKFNSERYNSYWFLQLKTVVQEHQTDRVQWFSETQQAYWTHYVFFLILLGIGMSQHPQHNAYVVGFSVYSDSHCILPMDRIIPVSKSVRC